MVDCIAAVLALELPLGESRQRVVDEFEQRYVARLMELHDNNIPRAAAAAGVARRHFQRINNRLRNDSDT